MWTIPNLYGSATVGMAFLRNGPSGSFEATLAIDSMTVTVTVQAVDGSPINCSGYPAEVGLTLYKGNSLAPWQ